MEAVGLAPVLSLSAVLFTLGVLGVLTRKSALIVFMSVELMLNAVNLSFVGFARHLDLGALEAAARNPHLAVAGEHVDEDGVVGVGHPLALQRDTPLPRGGRWRL